MKSERDIEILRIERVVDIGVWSFWISCCRVAELQCSSCCRVEWRELVSMEEEEVGNLEFAGYQGCSG
jgi:hypothetical protein